MLNFSWFDGLSVFKGIGIAVFVVFLIAVFVARKFRNVVRTNEVHVVQSKSSTVFYGKESENGNVYYSWPEWVPVIGVSVIVLPISIFEIELTKYDAFDIGRVPFMVDVKAFFQIEHPEIAAQRVSEHTHLVAQLTDILKGSVRKILASSDIEEIMGGRGKFGDEFTVEVHAQLLAWGVITVKSIEFMDIRDVPDSEVIANIMAKKQSKINMESRIEVANNHRAASESEIQAKRQIDIQQQEADEQVGKRKAEKDKAIGIAEQQAEQAIKEEERTTAEKEIAVCRVEQEKQAEIDKDVAAIVAEKDKTIKRLASEATLIEQQRKAEGIEVVGLAEAEASRAKQMAPVQAQIALAKEIGENLGYQNYLLGTKGLEVGQAVGIAKAGAMANGNLKIIANAGTPEKGVEKIMDLFSTSGGTSIGSMLEGLAQTDAGKSLLQKITKKIPGILPEDSIQTVRRDSQEAPVVSKSSQV